MASIDLIHTFDEIIQMAAKTSADDIQHRVATGTQKMGVHQMLSLFIGDDADLFFLADKPIRGRQNGGRLSAAEKAPDEVYFHYR